MPLFFCSAAWSSIFWKDSTETGQRTPGLNRPTNNMKRKPKQPQSMAEGNPAEKKTGSPPAPDTTSRKFFRLMADTSPDMLWAKDLHGRFLFTNKAICDNLLNAKDIYEPVGKHVMFFVNREREAHPDDKSWFTFGEECSDSDAITIREKKTCHFEEYGNVFGKYLVLDVYKAPLWDEEGNMIGTVGYARDITRQKQAEKRLKESEELNRSITESALDAIVSMNNEGKVILWNKAATKMFGYTREEMLNQSLSPILPKQHHNSHTHGILNLKNKHEETLIGKTIEISALRKDKTEFPIELSLSKWINTRGEQNYTGIIRDISQRVNNEKEIRKLSMAAAQSPSIIVITDSHGKIEYVNHKFEILTGYTSEEVKGLNTSIMKSGEHPESFYRELWQTITAGKVWRGEFHNKKKNGKLFWESAYIGPVFDRNGNIENFLKIAEDITDRKRKEMIQKIIYHFSNELVSSVSLHDFAQTIQKELSALIDTTNFYIALYDEKSDGFRVVFQQDEKDSFATIPSEKTLTGHVFRIRKPLLVTRKTREELLKSGIIEQYGSPSEAWLGVPLMIDNNAIGVFAVQNYSDEHAFQKPDIELLEIISRQLSMVIYRKQQEQELRTALEKARESDRLKTAFLSNLSHEIRTPMNGILGFASLIGDPTLNRFEKEEYLNVIRKSSERMLNTMNDIIEAAKIQIGEIQITKEEVSVAALLHDMQRSFMPEAEVKGLRLSVSIPSALEKSCRLYTDGQKLRTALSHLIHNAIKFTKQGYVEFGCWQKNNAIEFFVKDSGIGIPKNRQQAVFNRFEQADADYSTRLYEGSGLGLTIAKAYVEWLGGSIQVVSEVGKGSTFRFAIPFAMEKKQAEALSDPENAQPAAESGNRHPAVLIVEDDETSVKYLQAILKDKFKTIYQAEYGKKAVELCRLHPDIRLVLMDIKLPDITGLEATREIRKFDKKVIIIAQTAYAMIGDEDKALEAGCNDYIAKPILKENLFKILNRWLNH